MHIPRHILSKLRWRNNMHTPKFNIKRGRKLEHACHASPYTMIMLASNDLRGIKLVKPRCR